MSKQNFKKPVEEVIVTDAETVTTIDETDQVYEMQDGDYICPLSVNYAELEVILSPLGESIADYVGDRLPKEEVERIEKDFEIYLLTKHK